MGNLFEKKVQKSGSFTKTRTITKKTGKVSYSTKRASTSKPKKRK